MMAQASKKHPAETPVIPDRLYFKIGDVAELCGVATSVLRFWESQFPHLKPNKSGTGQRLYRRRDVEVALEIKQLVYNQGFTIAGACQVLETGDRRSPQPTAPTPAAAPVPAPPSAQAIPDTMRAHLAALKSELRDIAAQLAAPIPNPRRDRLKILKTRPEIGNLFEV